MARTTNRLAIVGIATAGIYAAVAAMSSTATPAPTTLAISAVSCAKMLPEPLQSFVRALAAACHRGRQGRMSREPPRRMASGPRRSGGGGAGCWFVDRCVWPGCRADGCRRCSGHLVEGSSSAGRRASRLLSPPVDSLCPGNVWSASVPGLGAAPAATGPVPVSPAGAVREPDRR